MRRGQRRSARRPSFRGTSNSCKPCLWVKPKKATSLMTTSPSLSPQAANFWLGDTAGTPGGRSTLSPGQELAAYRLILLIRRFEEKAGQLYGMGYIGGFCHLYIGQEAVVAGMQMALKQGDQVITGYRDHGHMLATGMDANGVMAELTGRRGGYS